MVPLGISAGIPGYQPCLESYWRICTSSTHSAGNQPLLPFTEPSQNPPSPMLSTAENRDRESAGNPGKSTLGMVEAQQEPGKQSWKVKGECGVFRGFSSFGKSGIHGFSHSGCLNSRVVACWMPRFLNFPTPDPQIPKLSHSGHLNSKFSHPGCPNS